MQRYRVLLAARLRPHHTPTGRTRHYVEGQLAPKPDRLEIVQYPDGPGYYLLYLTDDGVEITDTYHERINDALAQAEFEFGITPEEWCNMYDS